MRSIKTKIIALVLLCVLFVAMTIGATSIQSSRKVVHQNSAEFMALQCQNKAESIEALLSRIEQSVSTLSNYALDQLDDVGRFQSDGEYVRLYSEQLNEMAINAADNTEGAMAVYIRFNPEFTEPTSGLFASRETLETQFQKLIPTDFSIYSKEDTAHVGWYYIPVNNGKPTWMDPYLNENLNVKMISYVIPLIVDGVSVGVVGMDIDFSVIQSIVDNTKIYDSGYAFLADAEGRFIHHPSFETGMDIAEAEGGALDEVGKAIQSKTGNDEPIQYTYGGDEKKLFFSPLRNGMRLALTASVNEIDDEANALTYKIGVLSIIGVALAILISMIVVRGIIKPLHELTHAAGKIAEGQLDVEIYCHSKDEVGSLADNFKETVKRLKTYLVYINEASEVLGQLASGDLRVRLQQDYAGEFAPIKEALLTISGTLNKDMSQISRSSSKIAMDAEQMASGAQMMSEGAARQTNTIEMLSEITRTLAEKANENTEGAKAVQELARETGRELEDNKRQMKEMVAAMGVISVEGEEILKVSKTIEDIALQTNILAINASIEAARAGEAGKGFSIVAQEVKTLAVKSNDAAEVISQKAQRAVDSISDGTSIASETETSLRRTAKSTEGVVDIVERIALGSDEQLHMVQEVLENIEGISAIVEETAATAGGGAESSREMAEQAKKMVQMVEKFQLEEAVGELPQK